MSVINTLFSTLSLKVTDLENKLSQQQVKTISDLQTYMIVKERINDVKTQIDSFEKSKNASSVEFGYGQLSYAEERFQSAASWMKFFAMDGKKFEINKDKLKESCQSKISEAEERYNYVSIYFGPEYTQVITDGIGKAKEASGEKDPELCIMQAAQAKAEANAILSSIGVGEDNFEQFIESKSKAVKKVIFQNSADKVFPILGYSYYQYAQSMVKEDKFMALVYLEYALEMSDLEIYFAEQDKRTSASWSINSQWEALITGVIIGIVSASIIIFLVKQLRVSHKEKRKTPKSKR
jgi:predicted S18 family serine protease